MSDDITAMIEMFRNNRRLYAEKILPIRDKEGRLRPFVYRPAQMVIEDALDDQRRRRGFVRKLLPKARQLGTTRYMLARMDHRVQWWPGQKCYLMAHDDKSTASLYNDLRGFEDAKPAPMQMEKRSDTAKQRKYRWTGSEIQVSTAKGAPGRSYTLQMFAGSEVAYWVHGDQLLKGVLQTLGDHTPNTEIVLESTGNGERGLFYEKCMQAAAGDHPDWEVLFLPWFLETEYSRDVPEGWQMPGEWPEYQRLHNLTDRQIYWAYLKNIELMSEAAGAVNPEERCPDFKQEYPAIMDECFQTVRPDQIIMPRYVVAARKSDLERIPELPIAVGVDIAINPGGGDKNALIARQGRIAGVDGLPYDVWQSNNTLAVVERIKKHCWPLLKSGRLKAINIDTTGIGRGVVDLLESDDTFGFMVNAINFGSTEQVGDIERYYNKRAEMAGRMRDWFQIEGGVRVPDETRLQQEVCAYQRTYETLNRLKLIPKERMKESDMLGRSPDIGDALMLTHAVDLSEFMPEDVPNAALLRAIAAASAGPAVDWQAAG